MLIKRRSAFFLSVLFCCMSYESSAQPLYCVPGTHAGQPAQGMAIWDDCAYLLNHSGICRVYDLKQKTEVGEYRLQCAGSNNHANCASFGVERVRGNKTPLLYISQCKSPTFLCYVESVKKDTSCLVQTISLDCQGENGIAHDWVVDRSRHHLYSVSTFSLPDNHPSFRRFHIVKFRLPKISEGEQVVLTDKDVMDEMNFEYPNILQGGVIKGKYMYLPMGDGTKFKYGKLGRTLIVIDLRKMQIKRTVTLDRLFTDEPEDCDFYKGKLLLFCGQSGGLYEIPTK